MQMLANKKRERDKIHTRKQITEIQNIEYSYGDYMQMDPEISGKKRKGLILESQTVFQT